MTHCWRLRKKRAFDELPIDLDAADRNLHGLERRAARELYRLASSFEDYELGVRYPTWCELVLKTSLARTTYSVQDRLREIHDPLPFVFDGPRVVAGLFLECYRCLERLGRDWLPDPSPEFDCLARRLRSVPRAGLGGP